MRPLRVVIADDEPLVLERVSALVRSTPELDLVGEGHNGLEALDLIAAHEPDLIFIDVEMPELSGFGVIAALDGGRVPGVVFITAFERYAVRAFDVGAIDYLHKPITRERFAAAVERARDRLRTADVDSGRIVADAVRAERSRGYRSRYVVRRGNTHYFVPVDEIDWIDVADNYLRLHVGDRSHLCRSTMRTAEDELDPARFSRIHRSAMVAVDRIATIAHRSGAYVVELSTGARLRTSRRYADRVRKLIRVD
jgi:two-component system LytT family response regulator